MKIKYQIRDKSIQFGIGRDYISVDVNNGCFYDITFFLNSLNIDSIYFVESINSFVFLNLCKSIYHSQISKTNLYIENISVHKKFIISKVFGSSISYKQNKNILNTNFQLIYYLKKIIKFKYDYSIIFITSSFDLNHFKKHINKFKNHNVEFIYVINEPAINQFKFHNLKIIIYEKKNKEDNRFNISKKKNLGVQNATGKIVIIVHDRINLTKKWLKGLSKLNFCFDIYSSRICSKGYRFLDKVAYSFKSYIFHKTSHFYMHYNEKNIDQYVDGGIFVINQSSLIKKKFFDERLCWGELEDIDFIAHTKIDCNLITFDKKNIIYSDFKNHFKLRGNFLEFFYKVFVRRFLKK